MYFLFIYATADGKTVKAYVETSKFQKKYLRAGSSMVIRKKHSTTIIGNSMLSKYLYNWCFFLAYSTVI